MKNHTMNYSDDCHQGVDRYSAAHGPVLKTNGYGTMAGRMSSQ